MATSAAPTAALRMKLLVDTRARRVLFAEAGKDVVDFLFFLLALPVATVAALVGEESVAGSVGSLYASVQRLDGAYVLPGADKGAILRPLVLSPARTTRNPLLPAPPSSGGGGQPQLLFGCGGNHGFGYAAGYGASACRCNGGCSLYVTAVSGTRCPKCGSPMKTPLQYVSPAAGCGGSGQQMRPNAYAGGGTAERGFVQGVVTYTVMDDLTVSPMSTISSITLLNAFAVKDIGDLQEWTVQVGYHEGLEILKASLQSKTVLTDVFLTKN
ncbi:hypothetical protein ACP70R_030493 [Stipagrostis hirtigluma subsp. patula]